MPGSFRGDRPVAPKDTPRQQCKPAKRPFSVYLSRVRSWCGGSFRVIPLSNVFLDRSQGPQGNDAGYFPGGTSRKERPRAERPACAESCSAGRMPFFLVLFLWRERKRTSENKKIKGEEMSVSTRNAVPATNCPPTGDLERRCGQTARGPQSVPGYNNQRSADNKKRLAIRLGDFNAIAWATTRVTPTNSSGDGKCPGQVRYGFARCSECPPHRSRLAHASNYSRTDLGLYVIRKLLRNIRLRPVDVREPFAALSNDGIDKIALSGPDRIFGLIQTDEPESVSISYNLPQGRDSISGSPGTGSFDSNPCLFFRTCECDGCALYLSGNSAFEGSRFRP